jgi:hypothetical protein
MALFSNHPSWKFSCHKLHIGAGRCADRYTPLSKRYEGSGIMLNARMRRDQTTTLTVYGAKSQGGDSVRGGLPRLFRVDCCATRIFTDNVAIAAVSARCAASKFK